MIAVALAAVLSSCAAEVSIGSQGALGDDPFRERGERCGAVLCEEGQVCCNESCGICTEPDGACTLQLCDMCTRMDARGEGQCLIFFGYKWNGQSCEGLGGCECVGEACDHLFETREECEETFATCREGDRPDPDGEPCGPTTCDEGQVCCNESCGICTEPDGACIMLACDDTGPRPPEGEPCGPVTCSEGEVCCNESCGICTEPGGACIELACDPCQAMDAEAEGLCRISFGFAWDGNACVHLGGCSCVGDHCGRLFDSQEACEAAFRECAGSGDRTPVEGEMCARDEGHACETDADCATGGCGGELCYNPGLGDGATTCDCTAPAANCGCVDGTCAWWR
jgi:hypothetical protein